MRYDASTPEALTLKFKPSTVGLPSYMDTQAGANPELPVMAFSGYETLGRPVGNYINFETLTFKSHLTHIRGSHTLRAGYDMRHRLVASATYELPVGKGRQYMNRGGILNTIFGGYELSWIQTVETGNPFGFTFSNSSTVNRTSSSPSGFLRTVPVS